MMRRAPSRAEKEDGVPPRGGWRPSEGRGAPRMFFELPPGRRFWMGWLEYANIMSSGRRLCMGWSSNLSPQGCLNEN